MLYIPIVPYAFFGGQNIVEELWEAHQLVDTTFVALPIWSNVDSSLSLLLQEYVDGKISALLTYYPDGSRQLSRPSKSLAMIMS